MTAAAAAAVVHCLDWREKGIIEANKELQQTRIFSSCIPFKVLTAGNPDCSPLSSEVVHFLSEFAHAVFYGSRQMHSLAVSRYQISLVTAISNNTLEWVG